jgi:hypothetical protein
MSAYQYQPLDRKRKEIRLLVLEPGLGNEIIHCTLEHASIDKVPAPRYETISYVCGDPRVKATIVLHGVETETLASSEAALRRMRLPNTQRVLWIDAICISQTDVEERGHQVGLMYAIYTSTYRNLIWLGPDDGTTAKAFESMRAIHSEMVQEVPDLTKLGRLLCTPTLAERYSCAGFSIDIETSALLEVFENTWFSRLWVVQEASLASTSTCIRGEFEIPLLFVLQVAGWLVFKTPHLPIASHAKLNALHNAASIWHSVNEKHGHASLGPQYAMFLCLQYFPDFQARDPKDHIHATLGLWQKYAKATELPSALKPDYTLDVCTIYSIATRFAIHECKDLRLLISCSRQPEKELSPRWPSWVPHFEHMWDELRHPRDLDQIFTADDRMPQLTREENYMPNALVLSGIVVSDLTIVHPTMIRDISPNEVRTLLAEIERSRHDDQLSESVETVETIVSTVILGGAIRGARATDSVALHYYKSYKNFLIDSPWFPTIDLDPAATDEDRAASHFNDGFYKLAVNRRVFHTRGGHIGLGPKLARASDIVAILYGCRWPVVLRPLPKLGEFQFLGMCYVHGIMDGEVVRSNKAMCLDDTEFHIV